jgi:hypothetical protein
MISQPYIVYKFSLVISTIKSTAGKLDTTYAIDTIHRSMAVKTDRCVSLSVDATLNGEFTLTGITLVVVHHNLIASLISK